MKLRYLTLMLGIASSCLLIGCAGKKDEPAQSKLAPVPTGPRHSHSLEPIVIDNPDTSIGLLQKAEEAAYVVGPFDGEQTFILGHAPFKYIRIGSDSATIADPKVELIFRDKDAKIIGSMIIDQVGPASEDGLVLIAPKGLDGKLKWKRKLPGSQQDMLRLVPLSEKYEIAEVKYQEKVGEWNSKKFAKDAEVKIRLCVQVSNCPE